jgi:hypothetical protein
MTNDALARDAVTRCDGVASDGSFVSPRSFSLVPPRYRSGDATNTWVDATSLRSSLQRRCIAHLARGVVVRETLTRIEACQ